MSDFKDAHDAGSYDSSKDNEAVLDAEVAPLIAKAMLICREHGIPAVASFQFSAKGQCTSYCLPEGDGVSERLLCAVAALLPDKFEAITVPRAVGSA